VGSDFVGLHESGIANNIGIVDSSVLSLEIRDRVH
jgi:hypothetical protein